MHVKILRTYTKQCIGFGEFEGKCENLAGCSHTPVWCARCNQLRMDHITKRLEALAGKSPSTSSGEHT